jgi:hypothetical protein
MRVMGQSAEKRLLNETQPAIILREVVVFSSSIESAAQPSYLKPALPLRDPDFEDVT